MAEKTSFFVRKSELDLLANSGSGIAGRGVMLLKEPGFGRVELSLAAPAVVVSAEPVAAVSAAMGYLSELLAGLLDEGEWAEAEARIAVICEALATPVGPDAVDATQQLVPVVPTKEMLYRVQRDHHLLPQRTGRIWKTLLAAALASTRPSKGAA